MGVASIQAYHTIRIAAWLTSCDASYACKPAEPNLTRDLPGGPASGCSSAGLQFSSSSSAAADADSPVVRPSPALHQLAPGAIPTQQKRRCRPLQVGMWAESCMWQLI